MNQSSHFGLRIATATVCFLAAILAIVLSNNTVPRAVPLVTATGGVCLGVLVLLWSSRLPTWLYCLLLVVGVAGVLSDDFYEVLQGRKHWFWLLPFPAFLLIITFGTRDDGATKK